MKITGKEAAFFSAEKGEGVSRMTALCDLCNRIQEAENQGGEYKVSMGELSEKWKWERRVVMRFLDKIEEMGVISKNTIRGADGGSVIRMVREGEHPAHKQKEKTEFEKRLHEIAYKWGRFEIETDTVATMIEELVESGRGRKKTAEMGNWRRILERRREEFNYLFSQISTNSNPHIHNGLQANQMSTDQEFPISEEAAIKDGSRRENGQLTESEIREKVTSELCWAVMKRMLAHSKNEKPETLQEFVDHMCLPEWRVALDAYIACGQMVFMGQSTVLQRERDDSIYEWFAELTPSFKKNIIAKTDCL